MLIFGMCLFLGLCLFMGKYSRSNSCQKADHYLWGLITHHDRYGGVSNFGSAKKGVCNFPRLSTKIRSTISGDFKGEVGGIGVPLF